MRPVKTGFVIDTITNQFAKLTKMNRGRDNHSSICCKVDGVSYLYLFGGRS